MQAYQIYSRDLRCTYDEHPQRSKNIYIYTRTNNKALHRFVSLGENLGLRISVMDE